MIPDRKGKKMMRKVSNLIKHDDASTVEGCYASMHDTSVYEVEYPDGKTEQLTANIKAENIVPQVDSEGRRYQMLNEVTSHNRDGRTITKLDGFIKYSNVNLHHKMMNRGWKLLVEWKYGSVDWLLLRYLIQYKSFE